MSDLLNVAGTPAKPMHEKLSESDALARFRALDRAKHHCQTLDVVMAFSVWRRPSS